MKLIKSGFLSALFGLMFIAAGQGFPTDHEFGNPITPLTDMQIKEAYDYLISVNATDIGLDINKTGVIGKYWGETQIVIPTEVGGIISKIPDNTTRTPINISALNLTVLPRNDNEIIDFTVESST